jgi:multimeric flavodoxin WrbA
LTPSTDDKYKAEKIAILGICASPRKGNSLFLLENALTMAQEVDPKRIETQTYLFKGKRFSPCISCFKCSREGHKGECVIRDDFQSLRDLWLSADVVLYSVPVYHVGIPGQLKCFIDRLGNTINKRYLIPAARFYKVIGGIAQGMHFSGGQELAISFLLHHAVLKNCIPVSGDAWQSYLGASGWTGCKRDRNALAENLNRDDPDTRLAVEAAGSLGRRAAELAMLLRIGGRGFQDYLKSAGVYQPFLDRVQGRPIP